MADQRGKNVKWAPLDEQGVAPTWERVGVAVLMDIRDELQSLVCLLQCPNFIRIPQTLRDIRRNTTKKRRAAKRRRK